MIVMSLHAFMGIKKSFSLSDPGKEENLWLWSWVTDALKSDIWYNAVNQPQDIISLSDIMCTGLFYNHKVTQRFFLLFHSSEQIMRSSEQSQRSTFESALWLIDIVSQENERVNMKNSQKSVLWRIHVIFSILSYYRLGIFILLT